MYNVPMSREHGDIPVIEKAISDAIAEMPRTARALAVLNLPISVRCINESGLIFWSDETRHKITSDTFVRTVLLKYEAACYVLQNMTEDELRIAHEDCVKILSLAIDWNDRTYLREHRIKHAITLRLTEQVISDISCLFQRFKGKDRPFAIRHLLEQNDIAPADLPIELQQIYMWAIMNEERVYENFRKNQPG